MRCACISLLLTACSFSPLAHRIEVGQESFVIMEATGADRNTDLFAAPAGGGPVTQVTFTPLVEMHPRLIPTGEVVAFIRARDTNTASPRSVVLMNLLSGGELVASLPPSAGVPIDLAWRPDGAALFIRTTNGVWQTAARPGQLDAVPVDSALRLPADSALAVWLGHPAFALVISCSATSPGLCIRGPRGDTTELAPRGRLPIRWGNDSVAWFEGDQLVVRSLGPGTARRVHWTGMPSDVRDASYAAGSGQ